MLFARRCRDFLEVSSDDEVQPTITVCTNVVFYVRLIEALSRLPNRALARVSLRRGSNVMSSCQGSSRPSPKPGKITPWMRLHYPLHHTPVAPRASSKSYLSQPLRLRASFLPKHFDQQDLSAIAVSLEFLQRPNSDSDIPAPAPAAAPKPIPEPVQEAAPAVQETKPTPEPEPLAPEPSEPAPVPAQESQPNGAPIESKPEEPKTDDMSYADMAAKGPQQTDEQK